jgi:cytochrome c553
MKRFAAALLATCSACALAADPPPGRTKARLCETCHGPLGISNTPDAPNLAGQPRIYVDAQLKAFRSGKRVHEVMNVIARPLSDADIADLSDWYASIAVEARAKP